MSVDDVEAEPEDTSLRDELDANFSESEEAAPAPVESTPTEAPEAEEAATSTEAPKDGRDEKGRFKPKAATSPEAPAKGSTTVVPVPKGKEGMGRDPIPSPVAPEATKAPQSWKPAAREKWAALPPEAQAEVQRREREMATTLQETAEARKHHQAFQQTVGPFEGMIRAEGGEPLGAVRALLQTAAGLRTAPPQHKAGIVAEIIRTHGVDVRMLDAILAGQAPPQGQPQQGQYRDPRVDDLLANLQRAQTQRSEGITSQAAAEAQEFGAAHEFFEDVKDTMADFMETAARRGMAMSYEEAYNRAVALHPDVSEVVAQRQAAQAANASQASTQRARNAASSVRSQPTGPRTTGPQSNSLRDDLENAAAEVANR